MRWILLLILVPLVHAEISVLTADLGNNEYTYEYLGNESLLRLPVGVEDVNTIVNGEKKECDVTEFVGYTELNCEVTGTNSIITNFFTEYPLIDLGKQTLWSYNGANEVRVTLPRNANIDDLRLIVPSARIFEYDNRLVVHWQNPANEYQLSFSTPQYPLYILPWLGLLILIFFVNKKYFQPRYTNVLLEHEKKVVSCLRKSGKPLWTRDLLYKTKLSKVKMSRLLKSMEQRGLIEREAYGNSHKIKLKVK